MLRAKIWARLKIAPIKITLCTRNTIVNLFFRTRNRVYFLSCNFIIFHDVTSFTAYRSYSLVPRYKFSVSWVRFTLPYQLISLSDTLLLFYHCSFTFGVILRSHNSRRYILYIYIHGIHPHFEFLYDETMLFFKGNLWKVHCCGPFLRSQRPP